MKIANVLRRFSFEEWGGTESAVWNAAKEHLYMGQTPEIISTKALCNLSEEIKDSIKIRRFDYFYPYLFLNPQSSFVLDKKGGNPFSKSLEAYVGNGGFDIVHSHTMGRLARHARVAARKLKVPFIVSFHGGCYDVPESEFLEMAKPLQGTIGYGRFIELFWRLRFDLVESAEGVICVGKNEFEQMRSRFPKKKVALIPNGVDCVKFSKKVTDDFRNKYGIERTKKLILCVSRIDYQKNQKLFVPFLKNILQKGEDAHIAIVGFPTSAEYLKALKSDIKINNLEDRFTIVEGLAPDSDMLISAYQSSDVFALPSVHEPFGIVALEAWSAKTPLIASAVGGLKGFVKNSENGYLFESNNVDSMVRAYFNALENKKKIVESAYSQVENRYSWRSVAGEIIDFYKEVLDDFNKR